MSKFDTTLREFMDDERDDYVTVDARAVILDMPDDAVRVPGARAGQSAFASAAVQRWQEEAWQKARGTSPPASPDRPRMPASATAATPAAAASRWRWLGATVQTMRTWHRRVGDFEPGVDGRRTQ